MLDFSSLKGKTLSRCFDTYNEVHFVVDDDEGYHLYHEQDCCEDVYVESIDGDLNDLVGTPILMANEVTSCNDHDGQEPPEHSDESFTWTFYTLATIKGYVTIRFYGTSNGYYSESVYFSRL